MIKVFSIKYFGHIFYKNLANICSVAGILPFYLLFRPDGFQYLPGLIVYNNIMDDLDGMLAKKLNIQSRFGAVMDNLCDAVAHICVIWAIVANQSEFTLGLALLVTASMIVRVGKRLEDSSSTSWGSPTNELMRHLLFLLVAANLFKFEIELYLAVIFGFHALSLIVPFEMPHQLRSKATSLLGIFLINIALVTVWRIPWTVTYISSLFVLTYFYSFIFGGVKWVIEMNSKKTIGHITVDEIKSRS